MFGNLNAIDNAAQAASFIVGKNRPFVRVATKYWWVSAPAIAALSLALWTRHKKGSLTVQGVAEDAAPILGCVAALVAISEFINKQDGSPAMAGFNRPVKDAEFVKVSAPPVPAPAQTKAGA